MNALTSLAIAVVFGAGVQLMVSRDVIKLAAGAVLSSNAAVLLLVSAGHSTHRLADPLVQALAITAIVIGFGTAVLLLRIGIAVERTHDTIDMDDLVEAEIAEGKDSPTASLAGRGPTGEQL